MKYTTRIELHCATESDYEQLHTAMKRAGFSRYIKSGDGTWYHLPTAECNSEGAESLEQVLDKAKQSGGHDGMLKYGSSN